jgi:uncharacterized protein YutE (UPF0331/DUF86 family)
MAPDVMLRKLLYLQQLLADLEPYREATLAEVKADHYQIERILELLVVTATDLLNHLLAERGVMADSYRDTFRLAGEHNLIPLALSERLQKAAGMRNILAHLYELIDHRVLWESIPQALADFSQLVAIFHE